MPIDFSEIKRRRERFLTMVEAAQRATDYLRRHGDRSRKALTAQRWNDIEHGRYADPKFSTIEAVCHALECTIDDIRTEAKST